MGDKGLGNTKEGDIMRQGCGHKFYFNCSSLKTMT